MNPPRTTSARNCRDTLSSVLNSLSTRDFVLGSRSGMSIENPNEGLRSLSEIFKLQFTSLLVETEVVSEISGPSEVFREYRASMFNSVSNTSPAKVSELPLSMLKSLLISELSVAKWYFPSVML